MKLEAKYDMHFYNPNIFQYYDILAYTPLRSQGLIQCSICSKNLIRSGVNYDLSVDARIHFHYDTTYNY